MKNNIILIAGAMVAAVAVGELAAQPAFSQDHGQQSQYQGDHGPGDRFSEREYPLADGSDSHIR